jgi:DNA repair protein RadC
MNQLSTPLAVWELLLPETAGLQKEEFRALVINNKNMLIKKSVVSIGTITEAIVHPREVFRDAIREGGSGIMLP